MMPGVKVTDGPAVGNDVPFKMPFPAQRILKKHFAAAAGLSIGAVIGAHDGLNLRFRYQILKSGKIGFLQIFGRGDSIELVAQRLRAAVYGKVLGTGGTFEMVTEALQSADIGLPQAGGEIGIFTVGFMAAAPAGITKDINIGRPEAQTVVDITVSASPSFSTRISSNMAASPMA